MKLRAMLLRMQPRRYRNLFRIIHENRCRRIVEIGVWNGVHAQQMIRTAALWYPIETVAYYGFDLFEDLTDEDFEREFSKRPPTLEEVRRRLEVTGAEIHLFKGDTRRTLPESVETIRGADLIYIDGGHSIETIASDWTCMERAINSGTTVIFDDYYLNDEPEVRQLGCRSLIDGMDRNKYSVELLQPTDVFEKPWGALKVNMVKVTLA